MLSSWYKKRQKKKPGERWPVPLAEEMYLLSIYASQWFRIYIYIYFFNPFWFFTALLDKPYFEYKQQHVNK